MIEWSPLNDQWNKYEQTIQEASEGGFLEDAEDADKVVWPYFLNIGEGEKEDINRFVVNRVNELLSSVPSKEINPNYIASYIFRSVISGMMWEYERIGH